MKGIFNKANAPYVVAGSLATLIFLTSGIFVAAPYVTFLAPVAALNFGLPFIIGCAIFSSIIIGLSYVAANKNNVIVDQIAEIEAKNKALADKTAEIEVQNAKLAEFKDILINTKNAISYKDYITATIISVGEKLLLNLNEEEKRLVRKSTNLEKKTEYLLYIQCDKGIFRITGTYDDNFSINSVANQDDSDVKSGFTEMQAKLGMNTEPQNVKIGLEINKSNICTKVKSVVLDPTTASNSITASNLI